MRQRATMPSDPLQAAPQRAGATAAFALLANTAPPGELGEAAVQGAPSAEPPRGGPPACGEACVSQGASSQRAQGLGATAATMAASQVVLAAVGLVSLPILTRQLGPQAYGQFSLFVTLLGVVTYQDVARQLLIREETVRDSSERELDGLARLSLVFITLLALGVGWIALSPAAALVLALGSALHGLASRDFSALSAAGRAGFANAARNLAWAGAFAASAALCFVQTQAWALGCAFAAANAALIVTYRRAAPQRPRASSSGWWNALRTSPRRARFRAAALDLLGFGLASSAIACLDRVMLDEWVGGEALGVYSGAADVALRLHVVSSALSAALFPLLARELVERGYDAAAQRFVSIVSRAAPLYFVALAGGMFVAPQALPWLLGESFRASSPLLVALLALLYVHAFGFFITPWQRARGDFCTQRRAYVLAVCLMVLVGAFAIPRWGAWGAVAAFAAARTAELQLIAIEALRLPRALLPRWKLATAGALFLVLAALGAWRVVEA